MIRKWFNDFEKFLRKENLLDILDDPRRIANADEAAFLLEARQGSIKLIAPTGMEDFNLARTGNKRRAITCLATLTASGCIIPPFLVYLISNILFSCISFLNSLPSGLFVNYDQRYKALP